MKFHSSRVIHFCFLNIDYTFPVSCQAQRKYLFMTMGSLLQGPRTEFFKNTVLKICRTFFFFFTITILGEATGQGWRSKDTSPLSPITINILSNVYVIKKSQPRTKLYFTYKHVIFMQFYFSEFSGNIASCKSKEDCILFCSVFFQS